MPSRSEAVTEVTANHTSRRLPAGFASLLPRLMSNVESPLLKITAVGLWPHADVCRAGLNGPHCQTYRAAICRHRGRSPSRSTRTKAVAACLSRQSHSRWSN